MDKGVVETKEPKDFIEYISSRRYDKSITRCVRKSLPKMQFKNRLMVYYLFQNLNDPKFEDEFKRYLKETDEISENDVIIKSLDNEYYLDIAIDIELYILKNDIFETIMIHISQVEEILLYRGVFEVTEKDKIIYKKLTPFRIMQHRANTNAITKIGR
jgi:hypothetical protein